MRRFIYLFMLFLFLPACSPTTAFWSLNVSEHELHFDASGGSREVTVIFDYLPLTIEDCPEWITVVDKGKIAKNRQLLLLTASENESESARECMILVTETKPGSGNYSMSITVSQDGKSN
jgi:hypothetical protein